MLKFKLKAFSHAQNTPRTSREGNQNIFSKEDQTIVSCWRCFHETEGKLENISLMFPSHAPPGVWANGIWVVLYQGIRYLWLKCSGTGLSVLQ